MAVKNEVTKNIVKAQIGRGNPKKWISRNFSVVWYMSRASHVHIVSLLNFVFILFKFSAVINKMKKMGYFKNLIQICFLHAWHQTCQKVDQPY